MCREERGRAGGRTKKLAISSRCSLPSELSGLRTFFSMGTMKAFAKSSYTWRCCAVTLSREIGLFAPDMSQHERRGSTRCAAALQPESARDSALLGAGRG